MKIDNRSNDPALDAQRYFLGSMKPDEEVLFEHTVAKSPEFQEELAAAGDALTALYENLARSMPAPRKVLRNKLLEQAAGFIPDTYKVDEFVLKAGDTEWVQTIIPGVELKMLYVDEDGRAMMMAKLAPGTVYPPHERLATEECLVLSGDFWADNEKLTAGDFIAGKIGNEPLPL